MTESCHIAASGIDAGRRICRSAPCATARSAAAARWWRCAPTGHHDLEELLRTCAKRSRTREQVVLPHAVEALVVTRLQARPCGLEVGPPRHERRIVVGADV